MTGYTFSKPVKATRVNDPYLLDEERIVRRLGAYIRVAQDGGSLQSVEIVTKRAGQNGVGSTPCEQDKAEQTLQREFGALIQFRHTQPHYDRFVELFRADGAGARILNGMGLDFTQPDGRAKPTYIQFCIKCRQHSRQ